MSSSSSPSPSPSPLSQQPPPSKKARTSPLPPRTRWTFDEPCEEMQVNPASSVSLSVSGCAGLRSSLNADMIFIGMFGPDADDDEDERRKQKQQKREGGESAEDAKMGEEEGGGGNGDGSGGSTCLEGWAKEIDDELGGALSEVLVESAKSFGGGSKLGVTTPTLRAVTVPASGGGGGGGSSSKDKGGGGGPTTKRYTFLGLGKFPHNRSAVTDIGHKVGSAIASKAISERGVRSCIVLLPWIDQTTVRDISTSFYSDLYSDNRYRTGDKVKMHADALENVRIVATGRETMLDSELTGMSDSVTEGKILAGGVCLAKDIVNAPHNVLNSISMANLAKTIAAESGGSLSCTILDKDQCEERGMGAYLAVARGSETDPRFIHLVYKPKDGEVKRKVGIVGKGLLFDTGGYNIKTSMMELMKFDCGGAAAVLGAAKAISYLRPPGVEAHFIVAACENMISSKAYVPSDVLTASNGKTIEVMNTDAEGRLTLADALVYADREAGCERIIELSTLTGAVMVALGKRIGGLWTSDDALAAELDAVFEYTRDRCWRMPLATEYDDQLDSIIADLKNVGTRWGGAITAALFLRHFVDKAKPFAHIDIAGPVWNDKTGATGFGTKLVTEWIRRQGV